MSVLQNWAIENGCTFNSTEIRVHPRGGYGLFNSRSTSSSDEVALFIPQSLVISIELIAEEAEKSEELLDSLQRLPDTPSLDPYITVFLLYQVYLQRTGRATKWGTYLDFLPPTTLLPVAWNDEEIDLLNLTTMPDVVPKQLSLLNYIYQTVRQNPSWFTSISFKDFLLANTWTISRIIQCPLSHSPILVPILDMANHSSTRTASWERISTGFELHREPISLSPHDELCILYHTNRGSAETLFRYGFVDDSDSSHESLEVILSYPSSSRIPRGNVFRIPFDYVKDRFDDLSFLTYENMYDLLELS
jgi:hypothetical protein